MSRTKKGKPQFGYPSLRAISRHHNHRHRLAAKRAIRRGDEPAPIQPRNSAKWDAL